MPRRIDWRAVLGVGVGLALTVFFFAWVDWGALLAALGSVSLPWVALAATLLLVEHVARAVRWRALLRGLSSEIRLGPVLSAMVIGAAMNTLLPLRGGDLVRPAVLARRVELPFATVLATTVIEKLMDAMGFLAVVIVTMAVLPTTGPVITAVRWTAAGLGGACLLGVGGVLALGTSGARSLWDRLAAWLPGPMSRRLTRIYEQVALGAGTARRPEALLIGALTTVLIWLGGFAAVIAVFQAFALDLPIVAALFTQCALGGAVAVPSAPGYWGPFQVAVSETLAFFGADASFAKASAILFWAVSFVPVTVIGLIEAWRTGLSLLALRKELAEQ